MNCTTILSLWINTAAAPPSPSDPGLWAAGEWDLIKWLFDTSFGPPGPEGHWPVWMSALFHGSNLLGSLFMGLYVLVIHRRWGYRRDGVTVRQIVNVTAFIPGIALTRLARAVCFWGPFTNLTATADLVGAVTAAWSLYHLGPFVDHVLKLPSRRELHDLRDRLYAESFKKDEAQLVARQLIDELRAKLTKARDHMRVTQWTAEQDTVLRNLEDLLRRAEGDGTGNLQGDPGR